MRGSPSALLLFLHGREGGGRLIQRARDFTGARHILEETGAASGGIPKKNAGNAESSQYSLVRERAGSA